ncbi:Uncharacterised protein [Mycobacteroides abscessus subsp. massiliense]|nr:Uncharacterised protein [Mycobacteroides abscessus subsp. massiliense]
MCKSPLSFHLASVHVAPEMLKSGRSSSKIAFGSTQTISRGHRPAGGSVSHIGTAITTSL